MTTLATALLALAVAVGTAGASTSATAAGRARSASSAVTAVTDGDQETYWQGSGTAFPQAVQVDRGRSTRIDGVVLKLPRHWAARSQTLAVQGSEDGTSFKTVVGRATYTFEPASANTVRIRFPATLARFVRLDITANSKASAAQLAELDVETAAESSTNLALGKTLTASSANSPYTAANAGDGAQASYWESTNNALPQWIRADLGASIPVNRVVLKLPAGWERRTQTLSLQGSTDGTTYTDVLPSADRVFDPAADNTVTLAFDPVTTRYLRVRVTANTGWPAAQMSEFEIYGPTTGDTRPPTAPTALAYTQPAPGQIRLTWAAATDDVGVTGYDVYADGVLRGTVAGNVRSYTDTQPDTATVSYHVVARDAAGNSSPNSDTVTRTGTGGGGGTNLAVGKPITASSTTQNFVAANANDDRTNTYWEGNGYPDTLTVALGSNADVSAVVVRLDPDPVWGPRTQTIEVLGREQSAGAFATLAPAAVRNFAPGSGGNAVTIPVTGRVADLRLRITTNSGAPGGQVAEFQVIGVPAPNPDLTVTALTASPAAPAESDPITLSATVRNIGPVAAGATTVDLYLDGTLAGTARVGALAAGDRTTVSATIGTRPAGSYTPSARIDQANTVIEQNEANNAYTAPGPVLVTPVPSSDLVASAVEWTPDSPAAGNPVAFTVTLRNQGTVATAPGAHPVTLTVTDAAGASVRTLTGTYTGVLAPGTSTPRIPLGSWPAADGTYTVTTVIAPDAAELPVKQGNNTSTRPLFVGRGAHLPYDMYEAEDGVLAGGAAVVGPNRVVGDPAGEASGRRAVTLNSTGSSVEFTTRADTNTLVTRFSIPDAPGGGGIDATLDLYVDGTFRKAVNLTSKYAWLYGNEAGPGNSPGAGGPRHIYDEANVMLGTTVRAGSRIKLQKNAANTTSYAIDFVNLEQVAPIANPNPATYAVPAGFSHQDVQNALDRVRMDPTGTLVGVYLPPGTYPTASKFQVYGKAVRVVGAGPWFTRFEAPTTQENTDVGFRAEASANGSSFTGFAYFGNYTSRIDGPGKVFDFANVSNILIDNVWNEHTVCLYWGANTDGITIRNTRIRDTFADGVNMTNGSTDNHLDNIEARSTGDDSFALFSAIDAGGADEKNNVYENLTSMLTWRAAGVAVYGGYANTFRNIRIADTLVYSGITISSLDFNYPMNGFGTEPTAFENISIVRAGGHFWNGQVFPAIWLFSASKIFQGIRVSDVDIVDPTYGGIMFQTNYVGGRPQFPVADTVFTDISITGAHRSGDAHDAKSGFGVWANELPEPGQGPAVGSVTFNGLRMSDNVQNVRNTTSTFTITINP
ncbi:discoidin domain-containing protein [Embleya sp. NPDC050493]|uniref:discoidin domain-containing protein n=1 Tax=Embleya sp. NPDC050493 TaxID=3363989 RepID=UPI003798402C